MQARKVREGVYWLGAIDWNRRLFDALIPLPDGTSYNAYLVRGSEKTALLDTVDPSKQDQLFAQLAGVDRLDYLVAHHAEQDHSGAIPAVLEKYPEARLLCSPKAKSMLIDHLRLPEERIHTVEDGESLALGDKTLRFIHTPWVHWPETMVSYLPEERILFSCDFFGSHLATSDLFAAGDGGGVRGGQALLRRDHDALPQRHPEQPAQAGGAAAGADRPQPRADLRPARLHPQRLPGLGLGPGLEPGGGPLYLDARQHRGDGRPPAGSAGRARGPGPAAST